jgi:eukaryotic-like serine/threonine-protein kinase
MTLIAQATEPIPGYMLKDRIGAGGYGEVWAAEAPGELVKAIKFVYGMLDEDRGSREMKALNRIKGVRHPFLLSLERIEIVEGQLLIVTELAECSLKDRFDQCRKANQPGIPRDELIGYLRDSADALDYMNEQFRSSTWTSSPRTCCCWAAASRWPTSVWSKTFTTIPCR